VRCENDVVEREKGFGHARLELIGQREGHRRSMRKELRGRGGQPCEGNI
jgi:hypothetical protein